MRPTAQTLAGVLDEMAARQPDRPALVFGDQTISYAEWRAISRRLARSLWAAGVRKGDKVAVLTTNRPEWLYVAFAAYYLGAVMVPGNTWAKARELRYILAHGGVRLLVLMERFKDNDYLATLREICPELPAARFGELHAAACPELRHVVGLGEPARPGLGTWDDLLALGAGVPELTVDQALAAVGPDDLASICFTSGTTSVPKAVMLQHGPWVLNTWDIGERMRCTAEDRYWLGLPLSFAFACVNELGNALTHGGALVLQESWDADEALAILARQRCTVLYAMTNMDVALATHPRRAGYDLSALTKGITIGPPEVIKQVHDLGVTGIVSVYGSTEVYGNATTNDADEPLESRLRTQGRPNPGQTIRIVDPFTREPVPTGSAGLICVKGYVTAGYYNQPEITAAAFDTDGWYVTGDLGYLDDDGRIHYLGRATDMIKTSGINVSPLEIEELLHTHPQIRQAHVLGVPDPDQARGEIIVAVVEPTSGESLSPAAIREFVRANAARYKVPERVWLCEEARLPRTRTGKVPKSQLRELVSGALSRPGDWL